MPVGKHKSKYTQWKYLFISSLCLMTLLGHAQDVPPLNFGHLTTENGLSHNTISKIVQDQKGFIWFSTYVGVNRYDGQNVRVFIHDPADSTSLSNNATWGLKSASDGAVWVGTFDGLNRYDYRTDQFQRIDLKDAAGKTYNILGIDEDHLGNIWVATQGGGIFKISSTISNTENELPRFEIKHYAHDPANQNSLPSNTVHGLYVDPYADNTVWLAVEGLVKFDTQKELFERYGSKLITTVIPNSDSSLWLTTNSFGLEKINMDKQLSANFEYAPNNSYSISSNQTGDLTLDKEGRLWVSILGKGISILVDEEKGVFHNYEHEPDNPTSLSINTINPLHQDKQGNIWIGSNGGGINYYNPNQSTFPLFQHSPENKQSICANQLRAIFEDSQGNIWLSSSVNGINRFQLEENGYQIKEIQYYFGSPDGNIKNLSCQIFYETSDGLILMGSRGKGIHLYDSKQTIFRDYIKRPNDLDAIKNIASYAILELSNKDILFGTFNGIYLYERDKQAIKPYAPFANIMTQRNDFTINTLYEAPSKNIYLGTPNGGFYEYDAQKDTVINYLPIEDDSSSLSVNHIICFHAARNGYYWLGTWDGGLNRFDPQTKQFKTYYQENGLPNNTIYSIQEDLSGNLWMSTNKGISQLNPETEVFKNFDTSHNLQGDEYNSRVGFTNADGVLYFGGMNGLNVFQPEEIVSDTTAPKLYITDLIKYQDIGDQDKMVKEENIIHKKQIKLRHYDRTLAFTFSALKLPEIRNVRYEYLLEGFNNDWINLGTQTSFILTNLDQGNYELKIRAISTSREWKTQEVTLGITMLPPWWETWWAFTLYACLLFLMLYAIYNYRLAQVLKYQRLRTKISSDLHDDVGSILTAAAMQTEILTWSMPEAEVSKVEKIAQLNRKAIERMRDTVWAIDSRKDNMDSLLDRMQDFIFDVPENAHLEINFQHNISNKDQKIPPNIRQSLYLIFKEALNNALKYSKGNQVNIKLHKKSKQIELIVHDNGQVDVDSIKTSGLGLKNMKMRAENVNGELIYTTENGFSVICNIPL